MTKEDRDIQRKLKVLRHAEKIGDVARTCRYFGVGRSSFYRWRTAYAQRGEAKDSSVTKYNSSGVKQYTRQLGVAGRDTDGRFVATDANGNVYVTGSTIGGLDGNTLTG